MRIFSSEYFPLTGFLARNAGSNPRVATLAAAGRACLAVEASSESGGRDAGSAPLLASAGLWRTVRWRQRPGEP